MIDPIEIASARIEYLALPDEEWRKDYFDESTGGYVATHFYKEKDDLRRPGIAAEAKACMDLAVMGKNVLRLPENIPDLLDVVLIKGKPYRELLKFKPGETIPRGYPDAYFDGQTWDFKSSTYRNTDTIRQLIKDARKADNVVFVIDDLRQVSMIQQAIERELGNRMRDNSWIHLPDLYSLMNRRLLLIWAKQKRQI